MRMQLINKMLQPIKQRLEEEVGGKINIGIELTDIGLYLYAAKVVTNGINKPFIYKFQNVFLHNKYHEWGSLLEKTLEDFRHEFKNAELCQSLIGNKGNKPLNSGD